MLEISKFWGWNPGQVDLFGDLALTIPVIAGLIAHCGRTSH